MRDEKQMLGTGIVNYIFVTDADACVISYSCTQQYFYQIRQFSKDELDSYLSDEKEQGALRMPGTDNSRRKVVKSII